MAHKWAALKELSDDELIAEHDAVAGYMQIGPPYYLDELRYRQQSRVASKLEGFTKWIFWLTVVVTLTTVANIAVAIAHFARLVMTAGIAAP